jgi:hypothetical protein
MSKKKVAIFIGDGPSIFQISECEKLGTFFQVLSFLNRRMPGTGSYSGGKLQIEKQ